MYFRTALKQATSIFSAFIAASQSAFVDSRKIDYLTVKVIKTTKAMHIASLAIPLLGMATQAEAQTLTAQTISFTQPASTTYGAGPISLTATASSGLPVSYTSTTTAVCQISGSTATIVGAGTCTIAADQAGNGTYAAAAEVTQSFTVAKANQTLNNYEVTFSGAVGQTLTLPVVTASSGLPVTVGASITPTVCTVSASGTTVTILAMGTCDIPVTQAGNANYNANLTTLIKFRNYQAAQTITFAQLPNTVEGAPPMALSATASVNPTVSFTSFTPATCTVSGNMVTATAVGTCTIQAFAANILNSAGVFYGPASATQSFNIEPATAEQIYDIHTDQLNTPRMITDANGNVVWQWDNTEPFGNNLANQSPNGGNSFVFNLRFPGQYYDVETGTYYNGSRNYDRLPGRYLESDPFGLFGGQFSTYAYVNGNPLKYTDAFGLNPFQPSPVTALEEAILEGNVEAVETLADAAGVDSEGALAQARANSNKIKHIFDKAQHKLDPLVKNCGSPGRALRTLQRAAANGASTSIGDGVFQEFTVNINGISVVVRGVLVNGTFQLGTAFIP